MDKNIEGMKKLIQEKKNIQKNTSALRPDKKIGGDAMKGKNSKKAGGFFDK